MNTARIVTRKVPPTSTSPTVPERRDLGSEMVQRSKPGVGPSLEFHSKDTMGRSNVKLSLPGIWHSQDRSQGKEDGCPSKRRLT